MGNSMDLAVAGDNLLAATGALEALGLKWYLMFGTLLGAVREKGFIPHDSDTDIGVFEDFVQRYDEVASAFKALGFEALKRDEVRGVYAFSRKGEYIDFYHSRLRRNGWRRRVWDVESSYVPFACLSELGEVDFLGRSMPAPRQAERVLRILYGRRWRVPLRGYPSKMSFSNRVKRFLKQEDKLAALRRHLRIQKAARQGSGKGRP